MGTGLVGPRHGHRLLTLRVSINHQDLGNPGLQLAEYRARDDTVHTPLDGEALRLLD